MIGNTLRKKVLLNTLDYKVIFLVVALFFSFTVPSITFAYSTTSPEYAIKSAYIFNILHFVESANNSWLDNIDEVNICILGENKFGQYITPIEKKQIAGKSIRINEYASLQKTQHCQLVFIGDSDAYPQDEISQVLGDKAIIVVGDDLGFSKNGGMFSFYIENRKVRLGLNKSTLDKSGLAASSLLLEVCIILGDSQ